MFHHSEADVKKIKAVQFGIISPEECKAMSVAHIETDRTFDNGRPVPGGLLDLRLGTIDRMWKCATCGMDQQECPGHFGHVELAKPMYHLSWFNNILKTLRCVCTSCSVSVRWAVGFFRGVFSSSVDVLAPRFAVLRHLAPFLEVRWQARAFERLIQRVSVRVLGRPCGRGCATHDVCCGRRLEQGDICSNRGGHHTKDRRRQGHDR